MAIYQIFYKDYQVYLEIFQLRKYTNRLIKVSKGAKIRNR